jgi:NADPH-dependent 2,4-dienoyl-CoA reductase/sulfur reductase-like enzyme
MIVDDNPNFGGQIWRTELGRTKSPDAKRLIDAIDSGRIETRKEMSVFGRSNEKCLVGEDREGRVEIQYESLILATGARELFLPFPGWTLPNVFGAGGLQALVKGGLTVAGKQIVVAGSGPLLLAVAEYLRSKGAKIAAIAEQASAARINRFALGLWRQPSKIGQAISLRRKLLGIPYLTDCWVSSASGGDKLDAVKLAQRGRSWTVECDLLACGYHLVPNVELPMLLGCTIRKGFVTVDEYQRTSCENVLCAGEPTGIGGLEKSLIEGRIAGYAAASFPEGASALFRQRERARDFAERLNGAFVLREELRHLTGDDTIVCRCEDVRYGLLKEYDSRRTAKLQTRCGMGACQGRVCGAATEFLFGWEADTVRPPIFPVRMENL